MADPILVVVFLRGGADGLNLVAPTGDEDYIAARSEALRVVRKGDAPGLKMDNPLADVDFRLHPAAKGLSELYGAGELAVVHATGLDDGTRSHFDAEDKMERAAKGATAGGWIGRCLKAARPEGILPALAVGSNTPESLRGASVVAVAEEMQNLLLASGGDLAPVLRQRLRQGFGSHPLLKVPAERLITLSDALSQRLLDPETGDLGEYVPDVDYPDNDLASRFRLLAQVIKLDLGLRVATVDFGGWDTHEDQAPLFAGQVGALSQGLMAFWRDLGQRAEDVTLVVMSEFGRRLKPNTTGGTDHGHGNAMLVMGGSVRGGRMYGDWPTLANEALDDGADLAITTDYRHVLAEVLAAHMPDFSLEAAFPGFESQPLGLFA